MPEMPLLQVSPVTVSEGHSRAGKRGHHGDGVYARVVSTDKSINSAAHSVLSVEKLSSEYRNCLTVTFAASRLYTPVILSPDRPQCTPSCKPQGKCSKRPPTAMSSSCCPVQGEHGLNLTPPPPFTTHQKTRPNDLRFAIIVGGKRRILKLPDVERTNAGAEYQALSPSVAGSGVGGV